METQRHSQNLEEDYILEYFKDQNEGTFLDLGANDGLTFSNTRALAMKGFCGCLVEPSPTAFRKLKQLYGGAKKGCFYLYEVALGNHNGPSTLHDSGTLLRTGDTSLVSTLIEEEKKRFQAVLTYEPVVVKTFRWKTFLNRSSLKKFDFVSIDCEGMDLDVLIQMDLTDVKCLCIEHNGHQTLKQAYTEYCAKFGLTRLLYTSAENLIFAR